MKTRQLLIIFAIALIISGCKIYPDTENQIYHINDNAGIKIKEIKTDS